MFLTIEHGKLVAYADGDGPGHGTPTVLTTPDELAAVTADGSGIWTSSALDFPEEYTSDPDTLALVKMLHS